MPGPLNLFNPVRALQGTDFEVLRHLMKSLKIAISILSLTTAFVAITASATIATSIPAEQWNFTREDFAKLRASGRELTFSNSSAWFPPELKANLKRVLEYSLDQGLQPTSSDGVNLKDFFHGHLVCVSSAGKISEMQTLADEALESGFKSEGLMRWQSRTDMNFESHPKFTRALKLSEKNSGAVFRKIIREHDCSELAAVYHTYEYTQPPGMSIHDSRRHLRLAIGSNEVRHDHPVDTSKMSVLELINRPGPRDAYIGHFGFLVDRSGVITVTVASGAELKIALDPRPSK